MKKVSNDKDYICKTHKILNLVNDYWKHSERKVSHKKLLYINILRFINI